MQRLFSELPRVTEADLTISDRHGKAPLPGARPLVTEGRCIDGVCPICFNSLLAILAEEETAHAMDSPAHAIEELGVTKLQKTCGHIFCRKELSNDLKLASSNAIG
jgi:hypothetical protein